MRTRELNPKQSACCTADGSELTREAIAFGKAMERFKQKRGKRFPTWTDALDVLKSLGYRKLAD